MTPLQVEHSPTWVQIVQTLVEVLRIVVETAQHLLSILVEAASNLVEAKVEADSDFFETSPGAQTQDAPSPSLAEYAQHLVEAAPRWVEPALNEAILWPIPSGQMRRHPKINFAMVAGTTRLVLPQGPDHQSNLEASGSDRRQH